MPRRRRDPSDRSLTMAPGRRIPRVEAPSPLRPPPPDEPSIDAVLPPSVAKAAGELASLATSIRVCQACGRASDDRVYGTGYPRAPVMLLTDRPGAHDLELGAAFSDAAASLDRAFDALDVPLGWVYGSTAVRCGMQPPAPDEIAACATHLLVELEAVQPRVLVAFGPAALHAVHRLDGRCGIRLSGEVAGGEVTELRPGLQLVVTEPLPEGLTDPQAKRRLWRDLRRIPEFLGSDA